MRYFGGDGNHFLAVAPVAEDPLRLWSAGIQSQFSLQNMSAPVATLSPVPAKNIIILKYRSDRIANGSIKVYSARGEKLMHVQSKFSVGLNAQALHISALSDGLYFLKLEDGDRTTTLKFIKN